MVNTIHFTNASSKKYIIIDKQETTDFYSDGKPFGTHGSV